MSGNQQEYSEVCVQKDKYVFTQCQCELLNVSCSFPLRLVVCGCLHIFGTNVQRRWFKRPVWADVT